MTNELGDSLWKRLEVLRGERSRHELVWRDCFMLTDPIRASGLQGPVIAANEIARAVALIFDSTATDAGRTLKASIISGMTPSNSLWFKMRVDGKDDESMRWLDDATGQADERMINKTYDRRRSRKRARHAVAINKKARD